MIFIPMTKLVIHSWTVDLLWPSFIGLACFLEIYFALIFTQNNALMFNARMPKRLTHYIYKNLANPWNIQVKIILFIQGELNSMIISVTVNRSIVTLLCKFCFMEMCFLQFLNVLCFSDSRVSVKAFTEVRYMINEKIKILSFNQFLKIYS